jgi:uncharacterized metal-binding protein
LYVRLSTKADRDKAVPIGDSSSGKNRHVFAIDFLGEEITSQGVVSDQTCIGLIAQASLLSRILESHGFEVVSVACKLGNIPKEEIGLADHEKVKPGSFEPMCNPATQAEMLNRHGSEFNIIVGLCLGHDSLFFKHAKGLSTVLIAKDRVLGHNPIAALQLTDNYYSRLWGPNKPAAPAKKKPKKRST